MYSEVTNLWPNAKTVRSIDKLLKDKWLLDFQPDVEVIKVQFPEIEDLIVRYDEAQSKAVTKAGPSGVIDERELFRLLAHPGLFAFTAVARRHYLLDGLALSIGVLRQFGLTGPVLDVGCHIGASTDILGRLVANKIIGIDPVGVAIDTAKKRSADLPNVEFVRTMLPWKCDARFDMALCFDVLHHVPESSHPRVIASLGDLVRDGGYVLLSGSDITDQDWLARTDSAFKHAGLGFVDCDVLGGFGGSPATFMATAAVLLQKGDGGSIPADLAFVSAREWEAQFKDFANSPETPAREKTQAFERARRTAQA